MPLETKITLDLMTAAGCQTPGCTHQDHDTLFLNARCHPRSGLEVSYTRGSGQLRVSCLKCQRLITHIKVAEQ